MRKILTVFNLVWFITACTKVEVSDQYTSQKQINSFTVYFGKDSVVCIVKDSTIEGTRPDTSDKSHLLVAFTFTGKSVSVAGTAQSSGHTQNDFRKPLVYTVMAADGSTKNYTVKLKSFTGLPIIYISSPPVVSKEDYVDGTVIIDGNMDYDVSSYKMQIKGRGNSTWGKPKNPYKIKLSNKAGLLGMPADKEWALLANWYDKSLLRNDIAFELSARMGMSWTPRRRFVEVFMNGVYQGNYLLTETVKVSSDRLNINLMNETNPADTSNAYLLEADWQQQEIQTFQTPRDIRFSMKEPEVVTAQQIDYIYRQTANLERLVLIADLDLSPYIDVDSWIKWTIVNEVMRNRDAILYGSCFFYQGAKSKVYMGPVWDVDLSAGDYVNNDPTGWYVMTSKLVGWAYIYNDPYRARFKAVWNSYKKQTASIPDYIDAERKIIELSRQQNFKRWDIMSSVLYDGQIVFPTYDEQLHHLKDFLVQRINWMDKELNK